MQVAAIVLSAAVPLLSGCAEFAVATSTAALMQAIPSSEPRWVETNRLTFAYPAADVYALVVQEVERNDRTILERDAQSRSLLVSYPFSWLKNNWGGRLKITCTADEYGTTVTIVSDGRDAVARVRAIGDEVLEDVDKALRRQPRLL